MKKLLIAIACIIVIIAVASELYIRNLDKKEENAIQYNNREQRGQ